MLVRPSLWTVFCSGHCSLREIDNEEHSQILLSLERMTILEVTWYGEWEKDLGKFNQEKKRLKEDTVVNFSCWRPYGKGWMQSIILWPLQIKSRTEEGSNIWLNSGKTHVAGLFKNGMGYPRKQRCPYQWRCSSTLGMCLKRESQH